MGQFQQEVLESNPRIACNLVVRAYTWKEVSSNIAGGAEAKSNTDLKDNKHSPALLQ